MRWIKSNEANSLIRSPALVVASIAHRVAPNCQSRAIQTAQEAVTFLWHVDSSFAPRLVFRFERTGAHNGGAALPLAEDHRAVPRARSAG